MGVGMFRSDSCCSSITVAPNPDPKNFEIEHWWQVGKRYTLLRVKYPGCTTHGGSKLLLYEGTIESLQRRTTLDPHFLDTECSPVARFPASAKGLELATRLLYQL